MNGVRASLAEAQAVQTKLAAVASLAVDVMLCPPATLVLPLAQAAVTSRLTIGAQDCHEKATGAHTGDISAEMLVLNRERARFWHCASPKETSCA